MVNILLTGGRAPVTLDLARAFHRAGHTVFMAESLRGHLSQPSNAIKKNFVVPAPRQKTEAFLAALKKIIEENQIDLLIPTCEEVFHIAKGLGRGEVTSPLLPCRVFTEPLDKLDVFHSKWNFVIGAGECELPVPDTMLIINEDALLSAFAHWKELVLKPVYSRFAARTLMQPTLKQAFNTLTFHPREPWVAQQMIRGRQFCSYSVCQHGHVTAHATYPTTFTAGRGAAIAFQPVEHPGIFQWVRTFVAHFHVTGQMAFDFVETPDGKVIGLECNPRATSGAHLLTSNPKFVEAFLNPEMDCITPDAQSARMLATGMLVYGLPSALKNGNFSTWRQTFLHSDDVIFDSKDPLPFLLQARSVLAYMNLGRREKISTLQASTFDIEWNGD